MPTDKRSKRIPLFASKEAKQLAYRDVFGSATGAKVLEDIMTYAGVLEPDNGIEAQYLTYKSGRRDIAMTIIWNLDYNLENFRTIVKGD